MPQDLFIYFPYVLILIVYCDLLSFNMKNSVFDFVIFNFAQYNCVMYMSEDLKLNNQLCFPIYALSRQITALYRPYLEELGLTYPQYLVLMVLWERGSATVKQLGELLWLDSGTLTPLLKRMEANKLLSRVRSREDERIVDIIITDKGKELEKRAELIPPAMKKQLKLTEEQLIQLRNQLNKILLITCSEK